MEIDPKMTAALGDFSCTMGRTITVGRDPASHRPVKACVFP